MYKLDLTVQKNVSIQYNISYSVIIVKITKITVSKIDFMYIIIIIKETCSLASVYIHWPYLMKRLFPALAVRYFIILTLLQFFLSVLRTGSGAGIIF